MFFNIFSGKTYIKTGSLMQDSDGKTFTKLADGWISEDGQYIQKTQHGYLNMETGIDSNVGDPFDGGWNAD